MCEICVALHKNYRSGAREHQPKKKYDSPAEVRQKNSDDICGNRATKIGGKVQHGRDRRCIFGSLIPTGIDTDKQSIDNDHGCGNAGNQAS